MSNINNIPNHMGRAFFDDISNNVVTLYQTANGILQCYGNVVPADATAGFLPACIFQHTNGASETDLLYVNIGSVTSCDFNAVTVAS